MTELPEIVTRKQGVEKREDGRYLFSSTNEEIRSIDSTVKLYSGLLRQRKIAETTLKIDVAAEVKNHMEELDKTNEENKILLDDFAKGVDEAIEREVAKIRKTFESNKKGIQDAIANYSKDRSRLEAEFKGEVQAEKVIASFELEDINRQVLLFEKAGVQDEGTN